jgi:hypothetical protein
MLGNAENDAETLEGGKQELPRGRFVKDRLLNMSAKYPKRRLAGACQ